MSEKVDLRLDWCSYEAAKFAVEHWHYSKCMPAGSTVKVGVWENKIFIGVVLFSHGASANIGSEYGLSQFEVCELTRIALNNHITTVSKIAAFSIKMLKRQSEKLRLIVSFADPRQGHAGGVYQAMNWLYSGITNPQPDVMYNGKRMHKRSAVSMFGSLKNVVGLTYTELVYKHKYLFPLDDAMRKQIEPLRKPYPKRERGETDNAPQSNAETEGASPIRSLLEVDNGTP